MANRNLFVNKTQKYQEQDTVNLAGGAAYSLTHKEALAQYAVTSTFNGTYYASAAEHADKCIELCGLVNDPVFVAKTAVYARKVGKMKDTPVVLLAWLATNGHTELVTRIFNIVCNNFKQVSNFAQVIRSGKLGRKSFGTVLKRLINNYLTETDVDVLFTSSVGVGNPSIVDVIKMTHPKGNASHNAYFGYVLDKKYNKRYLPSLIKSYENYKTNQKGDVPQVPFQLLTNLKLNVEQWSEVARNMPWNTLRMNLNSLYGKGVMNDNALVKELAKKLVSKEDILRSKAFPYSIMTAYINTKGQVPVAISNALQDALEVATENVPALDGNMVVLVDVSGSMESSVTGNRQGATSKVSCTQVAGLMASVLLRKNAEAKIIPFDTQVHSVSLNPRDSVMTNAVKLAMNGGGTDVSCGLRHINATKTKVDSVIIISDNESWHGRNNSGQEWALIKRNNPKAKLVLLDIQPNTTTVVNTQKDVLNVSGFSDEVFKVISNFLNNSQENVIDIINNVKI